MSDKQWIRLCVFAAAWLPVYAYMTHLAVKWAIVAAAQYLQEREPVKTIGNMAVK